MTVPETAVKEDNRVMSRHDYVRIAGKFSPVESESKSKFMQETAKDNFGGRIGRLYLPHDCTSFAGSEGIHEDYPNAILRLGSVSQSSTIRL